MANNRPTILHIAGHGRRKNGTFDTGATGLITQGEHRYYANSFFDKLRKYQPKGYDVVYHTAYNVYSHGDIVALSRKYGNDTIVIEWHFDAASAAATGGHVIIYGGYSPDELDLRLRDGIDEMLSVRYNHRGNTGISGRYNLANVNRTANGGVNYRLVEAGFGTNRGDSNTMLNDMDKYAKVISEAIFDTELSQVPDKNVRDSGAGYHVVKSGDTLWAIAQRYSVKVDELKNWNNLKSDLIVIGQSLEVRGADLPEPEPEPKPKQKPQKVKQSISGNDWVGKWVRVPAGKLYGKGNANSPSNNSELSAKVESYNSSWKNELRLVKGGLYIGFVRISDITSGGTKASNRKKSVDDVAREIAFGSHNYGNGATRVKNLEAEGFNAQDVQDRINELLGASSSSTSSVASKAINVGSRVRVKNSASRYATGQSIPGSIKGNTYTVQQKRTRNGRKEVLLKEIVSWVYESDVQ